MKITVQREDTKTCFFKDIAVGAIFAFAHDDFDEIEDACFVKGYDPLTNDYYAINFKDGLIYRPIDELEVRPVDAELIIKEG